MEKEEVESYLKKLDGFIFKEKKEELRKFLSFFSSRETMEIALGIIYGLEKRLPFDCLENRIQEKIKMKKFSEKKFKNSLFIVLRFSKKGPDFFEYCSKENHEYKNLVTKIREENKILEKKEKENNLPYEK